MRYYLILICIFIIHTSIMIPNKTKTRQLLPTHTITKLANPLDCSYNYDNDDINFASTSTSSTTIPSIRALTTEPIVLVNIHGSDELYLGTGPFIPGKHRSLNWVSTVTNANNIMKNQYQLHDMLALPMKWSKGRYRNQITFIVIPAGTEIEYKEGVAALQITPKESIPTNYNRAILQKHSEDEQKQGFGHQIRMKYIPQGSVLITKPLLHHKQDLSKQKGLKQIDFKSLFTEAIEDYNKTFNDQLNIYDLMPDLYDYTSFNNKQTILNS
ncbi:hypothetical protein KBD08_00110 [Candidatus Babeliales bacterium]|nr:hypothetical protein [Candidatus Babeliales bacterium]